MASDRYTAEIIVSIPVIIRVNVDVPHADPDVCTEEECDTQLQAANKACDEAAKIANKLIQTMGLKLPPGHYVGTDVCRMERVK